METDTNNDGIATNHIIFQYQIIIVKVGYDLDHYSTDEHTLAINQQNIKKDNLQRPKGHIKALFSFPFTYGSYVTFFHVDFT